MTTTSSLSVTSPPEPQTARPASSLLHKAVMFVCAGWLLPGLLLGTASLYLGLTQTEASAGNTSDGFFWLGYGLLPIASLIAWVVKRGYVFWTLSILLTIFVTVMGLMRWDNLSNF